MWAADLADRRISGFNLDLAMFAEQAMKIRRVAVFQVDLPLHEGSYNWSGGKSVTLFDSTVVALQTDTGETGWGEACPLGPHYLPSYAAGVRAGIGEIGSRLLGEDPRQVDVLARKMDHWLKGHPYVKSAIDMACWDLLGKASRQPLSTLLGGAEGKDVLLYRAISQQSPEQMAARVRQYRDEGYRCFQLKVGGEPDQDIERIVAAAAVLHSGDVLIADANTGWLPHQALRVVRAIRHLDVYVEQPCEGYEQCLQVRRHSSLPFILDECMDSMAAIQRACADRAMDVVNIKISRLGGIGRARLARDFLCSQGIALTIEDSWGGDIVTAAIAHLAHSTPEHHRFTATDFNSYVSQRLATGAPARCDGRMVAGAAPGLGVEPVTAVLGEPVLEFQ
jgi:L-alanine-DL-glutamate epimerase-like enolase superfamily enzyme